MPSCISKEKLDDQWRSPKLVYPLHLVQWGEEAGELKPKRGLRVKFKDFRTAQLRRIKFWQKFN